MKGTGTIRRPNQTGPCEAAFAFTMIVGSRSPPRAPLVVK